MIQQINLYQSAFRKSTALLCADNVVKFVGMITLALGLIYGWVQGQVWVDQKEFARAKFLLDDRTTTLGQLAAEYQIRPVPDALKMEVERLRETIEKKQTLLQTLALKETGSTHGFHRHLAGLARQRVYGVWLRNIHLSAGGRHMKLSGSSLSPELIPYLIQLLANEPTFRGTAFKNFKINRPTGDEVEHVDFELSTGLAPGEKGS